MHWAGLAVLNVALMMALRKQPQFLLVPATVVFFCLLPETHFIHEIVEETIASVAMKGLESVAVLGGWKDGDVEFRMPGGLVPMIDLASSVLREKEWEIVAKRLQLTSEEQVKCETDEMGFWDRLGSELSALVYDHEHARAELSVRAKGLGFPVQEISAAEIIMPGFCQTEALCWQYVPMGPVNAALFVRFGDVLGVAHRGTRWNSIRDLLGALRTTLVMHSEHDGLHRGWAIEGTENFEERLESWLVNTTEAISSGHSKGGARAQHLVAQYGNSFPTLWHLRSFSSPNWVHSTRLEGNESDVLENVLSQENVFIEGDPVQDLFKWLGFRSQLAKSRAIKPPHSETVFGQLVWAVRAHFLHNVAELMLGESIPLSPFQEALGAGFLRLLLFFSTMVTVALSFTKKYFISSTYPVWANKVKNSFRIVRQLF